jgi:DNA repair exonuclease SbcCD nuclease subunit
VKLPNPHFDFQEIALNYQVRYVISGHIHRLQRFPINGVTYVSMESSGGRLQGTNEYRDGWFFGITIVDVHGKEATVTVKELSAPYGHARVTSLDEWGPTGLPGGAR